MSEIFGYTKKEFLKLTFSDIIHPKEFEVITKITKRLKEEDIDIDRFETEGKTKAGNGVRLQIFNSAIIYKNQKAIIGNILDLNNKSEDGSDSTTVYDIVNGRVRELNCLYQISELVNSDKNLNEILQTLVNIIPSADQSPEDTVVRTTYKDLSFTSHNFFETKWKHEARLHSENGPVGLIEVFHTPEKRELLDSSFGVKEKLLLNSIAKILSSAIDRKSIRAHIAEQSEVFQAIIEHTRESIFFISPSRCLLQFNKTASDGVRLIVGKELRTGEDFYTLVPSEYREVFQSMFEEALVGDTRSIEVEITGSSGKYWIEAKTSPVYLRGEIRGVTLIADLINDRKKNELILRESEGRFRSIVEQSLVGVYIVQGGILVYINPGFEKIFGYKTDSLVFKTPFEDLVQTDDIDKVRQNHCSGIRGEVSAPYFIKAYRSDGSLLHLELYNSSILYNNQPAVIGTLIDNTGRVEEELRINKAVLDAQERERLEIGMELHDNVKQILAGSGFYLDIAKRSLDDTETILHVLDELKKYNTEAITEVRRLSHQLAPPEYSSFEDKINGLLKSFRIGNQLSISTQVSKIQKSFNHSTQLNIYRILQEQLSNVIKYSEATAVSISIRPVRNDIIVAVKDNGRGFDMHAKRNGIGLENIRRRAQIMGGKSSIISAPGNGCEMIVRFPKPANDQDQAD